MTSFGRIRSILSAAFAAAFVIGALAGAGRAQEPDSVSTLADKVRTGTVEEKRDALYALRVDGTVDAARAAIPALSDPSPIVRAEAAGTCAVLPPDETSANIGPLLDDKESFVRKEAAFALGKSRAAGSISQLLRVLQRDKKEDVRAAAATALGMIGNPTAVPGLAIILQKDRSTKRAFIRREAATAIGRIAETMRGIRPVESIPESYLPSRFKTTLPDTGDDPPAKDPGFRSASPVLLSLLGSNREPEDVKRAAAFALGAIGDPSFQPPLASCSASADPVLSEICKEGLRKLAANR